MHYWLMKSEPGEFSIDDLANMPEQTEHWDGVRNYQARNMMRDDMKIDDQVLFYHSNCTQPGVVGIMKVVREGYPDFTAFDPDDKHFDPKSDPENPRWIMVDIQWLKKLSRTITLQELKACPELEGFPLVRRGNRLSIMPVTEAQWRFILERE